MAFKLLTLASVITISTAAPYFKSRFSSLVAFGDSFTDNCNGSYLLTNRTWPSNPAYFDGRLSNGPTWVEDVAANLSIPLYDYAYGGATTDNNLVQGYTDPNSAVPVPGTAQQLSNFLAKNDSGIDISSSLFVVSGGFNDVFFNPNLTAATIAAALSGSVLRLIDAGAQHFLFFNYYEAAYAPFETYEDVETKNEFRIFSEQFGNQLSGLAKGYRSQLKGEGGGGSVTYVDLVPLFRHFYFYGEPTEYGYDKFGAYGSCLTGAYGETPTVSLCPHPDKRVFWDEYHPTRVTHRYIAQTVLKAL